MPLTARWIGWTLLAVAVTLPFAGGCSRRVYRLRADREAERLVEQKSNRPDWALCDLDVYQDPRSRYYDPHDPDHPPKPCDDPYSGQLMRKIYGKHGMNRWLRDGVTGERVNPLWVSMLPTYTQIGPDGTIFLDLPTSNLLARIHSRDYQLNLEEVYLSALDVAFERFRFAVQYFGGNDLYYFSNGNEAATVLGRVTQGSTRSSQSIVDLRSNFGFSRRFATGAQLLASIANSMVWQFSGDNTNFSSSLINWSLVQPILRGGGKIVTLETLTRSERTLLGNLRAMAQFRQEFYKDIAVGGGTTVEPARIGGFSGGAGLTGFTGTGAGGFGGVGAGQNFGGVSDRGSGVGSSGAGGTAGLAGGGEGILDGFYGLVQRLQTIRNTEVSLANQELTLGLLEANFEAGLIDIVQVDEFRQNIETERSNLLRSQANYQDALESFIIGRLSLPPTLRVQIDDSIIRQFQLIDPFITSLQREATRLVAIVGRFSESPSVDELRENEESINALLVQARAGLSRVIEEHQTLSGEKESRKAAMEDPVRRDEFSELLDTAGQNLELLSRRLDSVAEGVKGLKEIIRPGAEADAANRSVEVLTELSGAIQEMGLIQATSRVQRVTIEPITIEYDQAFALARENRLDWMNQRAAVVDQWRLVAFNANRLLANLDVEVIGDMGTVGDSPTKFRGSTHNLAARVSFDAPLNRKAERNLYRESLIEFQRAKRRYVAYVDRVALSIRVRLRQIDRLAKNLEIQRRALAIAIRRVDKTLEDLNQPFPPSAPGEAPPQLGPTLAQNLLRALSDLRNTQDNFMSVWLNYEAARINLLFQLGIIDVAPDGTIVNTPLPQGLPDDVPVPPEDELYGPVQTYLDELEDSAAGGEEGIEAALLRQPDDAKLQTIESTLGETLTKEELAAVDGLKEDKKPEEQTDIEAVVAKGGPWRGVLDRIRGRSNSGTAITKGTFPRSLRAFKEMQSEGLTNEQIAEKTGWDAVSMQALAEVARLADQPVIESIPMQPAPTLPEESETLAREGSTKSEPELQKVNWASNESDPPPSPVEGAVEGAVQGSPPRLRRSVPPAPAVEPAIASPAGAWQGRETGVGPID